MTNTCDGFNSQIEKLIAGESGMSADLKAHLEQCTECSAAIKLHRDFSLFDLGEPMPSEEGFALMRARVRDRISRSDSARPRFSQWAPYLLAAAALVLGFLAGRSRHQDPWLEQDRGLSYSNVTYRHLDDGRVVLGFDASRYVEKVTNPSDPMIDDVLAQSLVASGPLNKRLEAVSLAQELPDPKVKEALIFALLNDPELAVRIRASEVLRQYGSDGAIRDAFIQVLREEQHPGMRMEAMDYLAATDSLPEHVNGTDLLPVRLDQSTTTEL